MTTIEIYEEMKSSLAYDLFELVDDYDEYGNRITIFKDESSENMYMVNVETRTQPDDFRCSGFGLKSKTELQDMSEKEFERTVNSIYYYAQPVD